MRAPGPYRFAMWRLRRPTTGHPRGERPSGHAGDGNARTGHSHDQTGSRPIAEASQSDRTIYIHDGSALAPLTAKPLHCSQSPGPGRQPRNCAVADVVGPRDIPHRFALCHAAPRPRGSGAGSSFGFRPIFTPRATARARPSPVRARISSRSNSARPPRTVSIKRP